MDHARVEDGVRGRLREACQGRSIRQVADETGFNHETVRRYLKGDGSIPVSFVVAVVESTGVSAEWLLNGSKGVVVVTKDRLTLLESIEGKARAVSEMMNHFARSEDNVRSAVS